MKNLDPRKLYEALVAGDSIDGQDGPALEQARAWAKDPSSAPPEGVGALAEPLALAVLEASVRARIPALAEALARGRSKALEKAAKRALYQLRSMGVEVPKAPPAPAAGSVRQEPRAAEEWPSLASPVTGSGERAVLTARATRGGLELYQAVISDEQGILQLGSQQLSRSAYRKQLAELRKGGAGAIELAREEALALLSDAAALNLASRTPFPAGAEEALRLLGVIPRAGEPPALPAPEPEDARRALEGHYLHDEPEILPWLPPEAELKRVALKADEVAVSPLQLSEAQKGEQILAAFHAAARAFFTEPVAKLYARRLWAMGQYFERTGRELPATLARAEARRLFHGEREPFSKFAEFLFEKVLLLSQRAQRAQAEGLPAPGVSVPLAGGAASAQPQERRSPGGLILP